MTLKGQIVEILCEQGYDFFTACEVYDAARAAGVFAHPGRVSVGGITVALAQGHA